MILLAFVKASLLGKFRAHYKTSLRSSQSSCNERISIKNYSIILKIRQYHYADCSMSLISFLKSSFPYRYLLL